MAPWKRRWVVLDPIAAQLSYFEDKDEQSLKGVILLKSNLVIRPSTGFRGGSSGLVVELRAHAEQDLARKRAQAMDRFGSRKSRRRGLDAQKAFMFDEALVHASA